MRKRKVTPIAALPKSKSEGQRATETLSDVLLEASPGSDIRTSSVASITSNNEVVYDDTGHTNSFQIEAAAFQITNSGQPFSYNSQPLPVFTVNNLELPPTPAAPTTLSDAMNNLASALGKANESMAKAADNMSKSLFGMKIIPNFVVPEGKMVKLPSGTEVVVNPKDYNILTGDALPLSSSHYFGTEDLD